MFRCAAMRCEVDVWARVAAAAGQPPILAPRAHSLESVRVRVRATKRAPFLLAAGHGVWARGELRCWGGHACARGVRCTRHDVAFLQLVCDEGMPPFLFAGHTDHKAHTETDEGRTRRPPSCLFP